MGVVTERILRRAIERGDLDCPSRRGKPLAPELLAHEGSEWWLAHRVLKAAGCTLPWIEQRAELLGEMEATRARVRRMAQRGRGDLDWQAQVQAFRLQMQAINGRVRLLNLKIPHPAFHLPPMDVERELRLVEGGGTDASQETAP